MRLPALLVGLFVCLCLCALAEAGPAEKARELCEQGKWSEAADAWVKALAATPQDRTAALGLATSVVRGKRADLLTTAQDTLYTHLKQNEKDWDVRVALGWLCLDLEQTKTQDNARRFLNTEAETHFRLVLTARPADPEAAAGLARTLYERGDFQGASDAVDAWLVAGGQSPAHALFWKGQALYLMALDAHRTAGGGYPLPAQVRTLFEKARGAYDGSVAGDPSRFQAWLQAGYCAQYLSDRVGARQAYEHALMLDVTSDYPLRGLEALSAHEPAAWAKQLSELAAANPGHPQIQFYFGWNRLTSGDNEVAIAAFEAYAKSGLNEAMAQQLIGQTYKAMGKVDRAAQAFKKALEANPEQTGAAEHWEEILRDAYKPDPVRAAGASVKAARDMVADYAPLFKAAPRTPSVRNNLAFTLREVFGMHAGDKSWLPVLEDCARLYEEASTLYGEWDETKARTWNWTQRWDAAQVFNDTGLMFYFYPQIRDLKKAEHYYSLALLFSESGFKDTFGNLSRLYGEQSRWDDLYEVALGFAEGGRNRDGSPDMNTRAQAEGLATRLENEGKVKN